jgi:hypothetical protein
MIMVIDCYLYGCYPLGVKCGNGKSLITGVLNEEKSSTNGECSIAKLDYGSVALRKWRVSHAK